MRTLFTPLLLLGLLISLVSCEDHRGFPPENAQRTRLKREYTRLANSSDTIYTGYTNFNYDESGRLISTDYFSRQSDGSFVPKAGSGLTYDGQGRLLKEITLDLGTNTGYNFYYDGMNRVFKIQSDPNQFGWSVMELTYDSQNRISGRTFAGYKANGDVTFTSIETYEFDARNNIILYSQTYTSPGTSFRRRVEYTYDDGPNPLYKVPIIVYRSIPFFNSPNNVIKETIKETSQLTGPFEPLTRNETSNFIKTYQNGLLFESTDNTLARKYEYETY